MAKPPRLPKTPRQDKEPEKSPGSDYEVGYGRPPAHSRFKPGHSGNPRGRPKRQRNLRSVVEDILNQRIAVHEGDRIRSLSKLKGVLLTIVNKSLRGDPKAQSILIMLLRLLGMTAEIPDQTSTGPTTANDGDIIADFLRRNAVSAEDATAPENAADDPQSIDPSKGSKR